MGKKLEGKFEGRFRKEVSFIGFDLREKIYKRGEERFEGLALMGLVPLGL